MKAHCVPRKERGLVPTFWVVLGHSFQQPRDPSLYGFYPRGRYVLAIVPGTVGTDTGEDLSLQHPPCVPRLPPPRPRSTAHRFCSLEVRGSQVRSAL